MPFADISLARGKSPEYLRAVSRAVHDALVAELNMKPGDNFQLIHQYDPGEMIFDRSFRGGPRSDDWLVIRITDGIDRGARAKRRFYAALTRLLGEDPGVRPEDVFVMMSLSTPEDFSFAGGVIGTDVLAAEGLAAGRAAPYSAIELTHALTELFQHRNRDLIRPMLRDDLVLRLPISLPYGGEFRGIEPFERLFVGPPGGDAVWESFEIHVDQVIEADGHLVVQLTNTAVPKATGVAKVLQNLWLFEVTDGQISSAQLYADTAAAA
ncbi:SnoaL-like domain-containing protein [Kribbella sandramycini]|uniref:Phenylpyruvate tautomerase PptA (4-oxalocrotonate tautomerase family) n=1 Tax=Kribbella sandramycini TaxID=60450 RepID=A0A7Y4KXM4_9ACTN|nr:tautomerase family protein [Kribbella sandramycini]MBB6569643.1 phenylpyruvate tautomerase PptA (4-oxalocrotonate tautomerase family) [Kribbella sandramycini]NOL40524.1 SnoaL-like domain-containing protein [Kribbella sandramycini]